MGTPMTLPTIHPNGTPKRMLVEQLCHVCDALRTAEKAMGQAAPNRRDWYPQREEAWDDAQRQHIAWASRIEGIRRELEAYALAIDAL